MIGKHYDYHNYNCAHFVAEWYHSQLNIVIPTTSVFELSFVRWLRKHFTEIITPEPNCIVYMKQRDHSAHVGVYFENGVLHNYKPSQAKGGVVHWPLGVIRRNYQSVTFWKYNG